MGKRVINFDILKVLLMLMIVGIHSIVYGLSINNSFGTGITTIAHTTAGTINYVGLQYLLTLLISSVNCFVIITGYFLYDKTCFCFSKVKHVWLTTVLYSICIYLISSLATGSLSPVDLFKCLMPVTFNMYWFVSCYLALILLAPFLAMLVQNLDKRNFQILLAILLLLNFNPYHWTFGCFNSHGCDVTWFVVLFFIGAYIRKFDMPTCLSRHWGKILMLLTITLSAYIMFKFWYKNPFEIRSTFLIESNGYTIFVSTALFMFFKNIHISPNRFTNTLAAIAPYSFAVYLIHDNGIVRRYIWQQWSCFPNYTNSLLCIPVMVLYVIAIFLICILIDFSINRIFAFLRCRLVSHT